MKAHGAYVCIWGKTSPLLPLAASLCLSLLLGATSGKLSPSSYLGTHLPQEPGSLTWTHLPSNLWVSTKSRMLLGGKRLALASFTLVPFPEESSLIACLSFSPYSATC